MLEAWLELSARDLRSASIANYRGQLERFAKWLALRLITITEEISPTELRDYGELWRLQEQQREYKASTVNNHLNPVRRWLRWLIAEAAVFDRAPDTNEPWNTVARVDE
jgi:site-specific recombinase XerD